MKLYYFFIFTLLLSCNCHSQKQIYLKDGVYIGHLDSITKPCIEASMRTSPFQRPQAKKYCECIYTKLLPTFTSKELKEAKESGQAMAFMFNEKNMPTLTECFEFAIEGEGNLELDDEIRNIDTLGFSVKELMIREITKEVFRAYGKEIGINQNHIQDYVECFANRLLDKGYTFAQALNSEDENGVVYNEIIVPCQNELMDKIEQSISSQSYNEKDILGAASSSKIKMIKQLDNTSKIKMNIGNNDKYFLFDTGASITMVDEPFSKKMILNGLFNEENLEGIMICQLADNSLIEIPVFLIDNLKIGSFTLNNVLVGTGENFILGHSVLNKFREWNIEGSSNSLILYK